MRPARLQIANFLSYADLDLDLTGLHAACVTGVNGSGKSALIDALLFAYTGKGRYRTLDEYVRLGQTSMMVTCEFTCRHARYRVIRRRSTTGRGKTETDLQQFVDGKKWRGIASGESANAEIFKVIGLDYETLLASPICRQGDASRLTQATPGERKAMLRAIFRLADYEQWATAASKRIAGLEGRREALNEEWRRSHEIGYGRTECEHALAVARQSAETLAAEQTEIQATLDGLHELLLAHERRKAEWHELQVRQGRLKVEVEASKAAARRHEADLMNDMVLATDASLHRQALDQADALKGELAAAQGAKMAATHLGDQAARAEDDARKALLAAVSSEAQIGSRIAGLHETVSKEKMILQAEIDATRLHVELEEAGAKKQRCEEQLSVLNKNTLAYRSALHRLELATTAKEDKRRRALIVERVPCKDVDKDGEPLGSTCAFLKEAWEAEAALPQAIIEQETLQAEVETLHLKITATPEDIERKIYELRSIESQCGKDLRALDPLLVLRSGLEVNKAELARLEGEHVTAKDSIVTCRQALDLACEVRQEREMNHRLAVSECQRITDAMTELGDHRPRYELALAAQARIEPGQRMMADFVAGREKLEGAIEETALRLRDLLVSLDAGEMFAKDRDIHGTRLAVVQTMLAGKTALVASFEVRLTEIIKAEHDQTRIESDRASLTAQINRFERLADAYKDVPVLILENVIPAIETEANAILAKIGSSGLRVRLETQRALKSKNTAGETLDIIVLDRVGERAVEGFSGGERFRVDFALRVGLAKVIARRSGAALDFLVIDEGFGSLDAEGLGLMMAAINRIQDEFGLILVVSHLETVQEGFASRLNVTNEPGRGSLVEVA